MARPDAFYSGDLRRLRFLRGGHLFGEDRLWSQGGLEHDRVRYVPTVALMGGCAYHLIFVPLAHPTRSVS